MLQETFDNFCKENDIIYWKEVFYHFLMARFSGEIPADADLSFCWNICLSDILGSI